MRLLLLGCALLAGLPAPPPLACSYPQVTPATRQLLVQIDQAVPRALASFSTGPEQARYRLPYVETARCFQAVPVGRTFEEPAAPRVTRYLRHAYFKQLGDTTDTREPHSFGTDVLEYSSPATAAAAQRVLDSLVATCNGRIQELEPCVRYRRYRVSRHGACLLRFRYYSQDPVERMSLGGLVGRLHLPPAALPAPAVSRPRR